MRDENWRSLREFEALHSTAEDPPFAHRGWVYYADGARREDAMTGVWIEPTDPRELARGKAFYRRLVWERATLGFENCRRMWHDHLRAITNSRGVMQTPPPVDVDRMRRELFEFKTLVQEAHAKLQEAEAELEALTPKAEKGRQAESDATKAKASEALEVLQGISL